MVSRCTHGMPWNLKIQIIRNSNELVRESISNGVSVYPRYALESQDTDH